jgi:hypothetical protein
MLEKFNEISQRSSKLDLNCQGVDLISVPTHHAQTGHKETATSTSFSPCVNITMSRPLLPGSRLSHFIDVSVNVVDMNNRHFNVACLLQRPAKDLFKQGKSPLNIGHQLATKNSILSLIITL